MKKAFRRISTGDVDSKQAKAYWADEFRGLRRGLLIDFPVGDRFSASLTWSKLGPANLLAISTDPMSMARVKHYGPKEIVDDLCLLYIRRGAARLSSGGSDTPLEDGRYALIDASVPYSVRFVQRTDFKAVKFPRAWLSSRIGALDELASKPLPGNQAWGAVLTAALEALEPEFVDQLALPPGAVADQVAALLALAAGPFQPMKTWRRSMLRRLRQSMQDRLHEQALDPAVLAAEQGISKRTLHALFAAAGSTFGRELMAARLERARLMLLDHRLDDKQIAEIASLVGFRNAAHFGRCFLNAYGVSPLAYRLNRQVGTR